MMGHGMMGGMGGPGMMGGMGGMGPPGSSPGMGGMHGGMGSPGSPGMMGGFGMMGGGQFGHAMPNFQDPFAPPMFHQGARDETPCGGGVGNNQSVKFNKVLGKGKFGETWEVEYNGEICAGKVTWCPDGFPDCETEMLRGAQGPYTCVFIGQEDKTPKGTCLLMQCYPSNLDERMKALRKVHVKKATARGNRQGLPKQDFINVIENLASGLEWFHARGIMFGDLKPDNMLHSEAENKIVYADFGDSRKIAAGQSERIFDPHSTGWGHPQYHCVPDVQRAIKNTSGDMWMLAQTAVHLWTGNDCEHNPEKLPERMPLHDMFKRCHDSEPTRRPSPTEFLAAMREFKATRARQELPEDEVHKKYKHDESKMSRRAAAVAIAAAEGIELNSPKSPHNMVLTPKGSKSKSKKAGRNSLLKESAARNATKSEVPKPAPAVPALRVSGGPPSSATATVARMQSARASTDAPAAAAGPVPIAKASSYTHSVNHHHAQDGDWRHGQDTAVSRIRNRHAQSPPNQSFDLDADLQRVHATLGPGGPHSPGRSPPSSPYGPGGPGGPGGYYGHDGGRYGGGRW